VGDESGRTVYPTGIEGLEDCRLFRWQAWWVTATVRDSNEAATARVVLGRVDIGAGTATIRDLVELPSPHPGLHEKNWAPFAVGDALHLLYRWQPRRIMSWDGNNLEVVTERSGDAEQVSETARRKGHGWRMVAVRGARSERGRQRPALSASFRPCGRRQWG
jgi:hypothetical protein